MQESWCAGNLQDLFISGSGRLPHLPDSRPGRGAGRNGAGLLRGAPPYRARRRRNRHSWTRSLSAAQQRRRAHLGSAAAGRLRRRPHLRQPLSGGRPNPRRGAAPLLQRQPGGLRHPQQRQRGHLVRPRGDHRAGKGPFVEIPRHRTGPRHSTAKRPSARALLGRREPRPGDLAQPAPGVGQGAVIHRFPERRRRPLLEAGLQADPRRIGRMRGGGNGRGARCT